jgi:activating signal cointegrator complex subunit 2
MHLLPPRLYPRASTPASSTPAPGPQDTEHRGQVLTEQLSACSSGAAPQAPGGQRALLPALNAAFRLDSALSEAAASGLLALDGAQFDYLLALLGGDRRLLAPAPASGGGGGARGRAPGQGASPSGAGGPWAPEPAVVGSLVSQVREMLPDYGDGFVAACLHASGYQAEAVINALLEGALPASVQGLDPQLASWAPPAAGGARARGGAAAAGPSSDQVGGCVVAVWRSLACGHACRNAGTAGGHCRRGEARRSAGCRASAGALSPHGAPPPPAAGAAVLDVAGRRRGRAGPGGGGGGARGRARAPAGRAAAPRRGARHGAGAGRRHGRRAAGHAGAGRGPAAGVRRRVRRRAGGSPCTGAAPHELRALSAVSPGAARRLLPACGSRAGPGCPAPL